MGIGGTIVLSVDNKFAGMCLFYVALLTIYFFDFNLFTGKAGYIPRRPLRYIPLEVIPIWLGNFTGTFLFAQAMLHTVYGAEWRQNALRLVEQKCRGTALSCVILAALCGMIVYFAVDMYHRYREKNLMAALTYSFVCVVVFQACHFEHSIADMYFFSMAGAVSSHFKYLLLFSLGNLLGCAFEPFCERVARGGMKHPV